MLSQCLSIRECSAQAARCGWGHMTQSSGILLPVQAPFFFFAGKVIDRLGVKRVIDVALSAYVLRWACLSCVPPAAWEDCEARPAIYSNLNGHAVPWYRCAQCPRLQHVSAPCSLSVLHVTLYFMLALVVLIKRPQSSTKEQKRWHCLSSSSNPSQASGNKNEETSLTQTAPCVAG